MNNELAKALSEFQAELVTVGKTANNPFFKSKYADLATIMQQTQPVLTKHGLSVMQLPDNLDGRPALTTIVYHSSGQSERSTIPLILAKEDPQGVGSAITYMRRYAYAAALQIVIDEDDDGNRASYQKASQTTLATPQRPVYGANDATPAQKKEIARILEMRDQTTIQGQQAYIKNMGYSLPLTVAAAEQLINELKTSKGLQT